MKLAQRLTLKQLRALVAVADSASFTQAARLLHLTQPAISMQIRDAEAIVGQVLVDGRREIHLTPAGEIVARAARQALQALELAEVELKARGCARCCRISAVTWRSWGSRRAASTCAGFPSLRTGCPSWRARTTAWPDASASRPRR